MRRFLAAGILLLLFAGCAPKRPLPSPTYDPTPFLKQLPPQASEERSRLYRDFLRHRYAPWLMREINATKEEATWAVDHFAAKKIYGENYRPVPKKRYEAWVRNARYDAFGSLNRHALVTHPSSLRLFPTFRPIFLDPSQDGEGFPFDYNQNSAIAAMTPLIVSHLSMDGGWAFVQSPFALGWLPVRDLAYVDDEEIEALTKRPLAVLLRERAPLYDAKEHFLFYAKSASLFPTLGERGDFWEILLPRCETLTRAPLPKAWSAPMPLAMDATRVTKVLDLLLKEPYGWGGLLQNRDCSATTRDFFRFFGIWLPRNSKAQAQVGRVLDLHGLSDAEKERTIVEKGIPFHTLLYLPGHIMLYIGHIDGRAYALHNLWGVRLKGDGRHIVGETVITDLFFGEEIPDADPDALPIRRIESMNIVTER